MNRLRPLFIGLVILLFFGVALWLRIVPPYNSIFTSAGVRFSTVDAYYHMYIVDNLAFNFPKLSDFMPYLNFPGGHGSPDVYFFNWLLAAVIWIASLGNPTQHLIDVIGAYYPAVLGALTIIPVYFIGKTLVGRWGGIIAAAVLSVLPGEFIGRSILGSTDQHVAETLLTSVAMLFLILALKAAKEKNLNFEQIKKRNWPVLIKPLGYSLLAGLFLGLYLLTWMGALLFVFIIGAAVLVQFIIDHMKGKPTDYLTIVNLVLMSVAAVMILPALPNTLNLIAFGAIIPGIIALHLLSRFMKSRQLKRRYFPFTLGGLAIIGVTVLYFAVPSLFQQLLAAFSIFHPTGASLTTLEMQPILSPTGSFTLVLVWGNFTASFFIALIALLVLIYLVWKHGDADKTLLLVWGLVILIATIGQRRFAYYFAVNAAVLTGYFSTWVMDKCGVFKTKTASENSLFTLTIGVVSILFLAPSLSPSLGFLNPFTWIGIPAALVFFVALFLGRSKLPEREIRAKRQAIVRPEKRVPFNPNYVNLALSLILIFLMIVYPNVAAASQTSTGATFAPSDAWMESMSWLKNNSPDPFGDQDMYYKTTSSTTYPPSAYGVLSWWDYGYWITRIAHRIPTVNPSQDSVLQNKVGTIFTSQNESQADELVKALQVKYVVIDDQTALGKFWAVATWAGKLPSEYSEMFYLPQQSGTQTQLVPVQLYFPEYYRSMVIRLFNFEGKAVTNNLTASQVAALSQWLMATPPASPTGLNATAGNGRISLAWTVANVTNLSGFRIERATNSGFSNGISIIGPAGVSAYSDYSAEPTTNYYYRVFAVNSVGESTASNSVSITSGSANVTVQPPAPPTAVNATAMGSTAVTISWTDNSANETGFRIDRSTTSSFTTNRSMFVTLANSSSYTDTSISANTTYYYRVVAYNEGGNSDTSTSASVSIPGDTTDAPTVYATNCASCHGINRDGVGTNPALTASALSKKSLDDLNVTIASGTNNGMPGFQARQVFVVKYEDRKVDATHTIKLITDAQPFDTYGAANTYLQSHTGNYRIVGPNPFVSPVPLDAVKDYKLIFGSAATTDTGVGMTSQVKIFQYIGNSTATVK